MNQYDVIVVGAGPAGSTTAAYAAGNDLDVLLLDKKKEIGNPVQCGEFLPSAEEMKRIMPKENNHEELFALDEGLISKRTDRIKIYSPKLKVYDLKFDGFSVERKYFDKFLAGKAVKNGAELKTDTIVTSLNGNKVVTKSGEEFIGKVIVGADGYRSKIAEMAGFEIPDTLYRCMLCEIPGDFEPTVEMYFGTIAPGGYAWIIPKKDSANIGLGVQNRGIHPLKELLIKFLKSKNIETKPRFWSAGYVPVSGPIPQTVKGNVLVVGDAAGQVMATNGGGIPISMICGRIAGNIIGQHFQTGQSLETYETEWRKSVGRELEISLKTKRMADIFFKKDWALEIAMSMMGEKRMDRAIKCKPVFFGGKKD